MGNPDSFYILRLPNGCAAGSSEASRLISHLATLPPGKYEIELSTRLGFLSPKVRRWGWAIKEADGRAAVSRPTQTMSE